MLSLVHTGDNIVTLETATQEPWVDAATIGAHIGFKHDAVRKMARTGRIPGVPMKNGAKTYWRFKLSAVEAFLNHSAPTIEQMNSGTPEVSAFAYREARQA